MTRATLETSVRNQLKSYDDYIRTKLQEQKRIRENDEDATLSSNSVEMYKGLIKRAYGGVLQGTNHKGKNIQPETFIIQENEENIIEYVKNYDLKTRANFFSALYAYTNDPEYRVLARNAGRETKEETDKQIANDKEIENWVSDELYDEVLTKQSKIANEIINSKTEEERELPESYTDVEFQSIQNWIILELYSNKHIAVRRSQDFTEMKLRGIIDREDDNEIEGNFGRFIFNKFKTAKYQKDKRQATKIKPRLKKILILWSKINPNDYLLVNKKGKKLNHTTLYQRFAKLLDKNASVNMIRKKTFTGYGLKYAEAQKKREEANEIERELAENMRDGGSNIRNAPYYEKINMA